MVCPTCDTAVAHDIRWARLYNAVYFIFFSQIILILLVPLALQSVGAYLGVAFATIVGFWGLGKMAFVPLRVHANPFLDKIQLYLTEFGFRDFSVKSALIDPKVPTNSEVLIHLGPLRLRFLRDGLQEYMEFGDSDALYGEYYTYDDVFVSHGWLNSEEVANRNTAIGLYDACKGLKNRIKELYIVFDPANIEVALTKVRLTRDHRHEQKGGN